ncbi:MAG TPA: hypothetical protein VFH99_01805 [Candidatus Saccharimonadales bacterium]|nr:hypothetical protein [Candidatus Saccharimonadales bacterium]
MERVEETLEFKRYAASCGEQMRLDGKVRRGAAIQLAQLLPKKAYVYRHAPPSIKAGIYAVWATAAGAKLFEAEVTYSETKEFREGNNLVGIVGPDASLLVSNTSSDEDMEHLISSYKEGREHALLNI